MVATGHRQVGVVGMVSDAPEREEPLAVGHVPDPSEHLELGARDSLARVRVDDAPVGPPWSAGRAGSSRPPC